MQLYGTSFNLDGIYGGRMTPGAKAVMPLKIISKHNIRFNANQDANDLVLKLRRHLDNRGYVDVKIDVVGVMDWVPQQLGSRTCQSGLENVRRVQRGLRP